PTDDKYVAMALISSINMLSEMYGDSKFVKNGDAYVSEYTTNMEGVMTKIITTLNTENDMVTSYKMVVAVSLMQDNAEAMDMNIETDGFISTFTFNMSSDKSFSLTSEGTVTLSQSTNKPVAAPPTGNPVISIMDMLGSLH
ncbi:MAG: hypothetical protein ACRCW1_07215, partial [Anaerotignaceae bacterium]